jgi:hypothetical protein
MHEDLVQVKNDIAKPNAAVDHTVRLVVQPTFTTAPRVPTLRMADFHDPPLRYLFSVYRL